MYNGNYVIHIQD